MNSSDRKFQSDFRPAKRSDAAALKKIMAPIIAETTATFATSERSISEWEELIEKRLTKGHAFYVAEYQDEIIGYASYDQFRPNFDAYQNTMEHSVYLSKTAQREGLGRVLMLMIEEHAREAGHHSMIGVIDADNAASIAFHVALGYDITGRIPKVGHKFDRWLDILFLQKFL